MRLFDGSAEYVRADELKVGDTIRHGEHFREITHISEEEETDGRRQVGIKLGSINLRVVRNPSDRVLRKL